VSIFSTYNLRGFYMVIQGAEYTAAHILDSDDQNLGFLV